MPIAWNFFLVTFWGFSKSHASASLNSPCDDPWNCRCWPFWAICLLYFPLRALNTSLTKGKTGGMKPNYHPAVLPFSFPFFVFLVMLYLHFAPPFEGDAASALSHTQSSHFLSQGSCSNGNIVGFLMLQTLILILASVFMNWLTGDFSWLLCISISSSV